MVNRDLGLALRPRASSTRRATSGSRGDRRRHPELLDWLAATFVEQGWSVKQLHRLILTSEHVPAGRTQPARSKREARLRPSPTESDPDNRLLSHFPRRRLEAEALYDAMLSTTNALPRQPSGAAAGVRQEQQPGDVRADHRPEPQGAGAGRAEDAGAVRLRPDRRQPGRPRPASATPAQSLFWLNSPLVKYFADEFADRLLKMDKLTDAKRLEMAYLLGRRPAAERRRWPSGRWRS